MKTTISEEVITFLLIATVAVGSYLAVMGALIYAAVKIVKFAWS